MSAGKHVIFLGAGASKSSGYPLARDLRLAMTSIPHFSEWLAKHLPSEVVVVDNVNMLRHDFQGAIFKFREGSYASVDEFGMIARGGMQREVQELKRLMSFVLGIVNPLAAYGDSTYYAFANALFKKDSAQLRDDIAVLTFNYDPHLEFVIHSARKNRREASACSAPLEASASSMLSGFAGETNNWEDESGFCLLKLHGTIAIQKPPVPCDRVLTFDEVFHSRGLQRMNDIASRTISGNVTPVVFPWELFDDSGDLLPAEKCPWNCSIPGNGQLHDIMAKIWNRAHREVARAATISFVGLSMHHYLQPGFRRLLADHERKVRLVVANPDMKPQGELMGREKFSPRSSIRKIMSFLDSDVPGLQRTATAAYLGFEEFIAAELAG